MKNCDYCGRENEDTVDRCRECGTRFPAPVTSEVSQAPSLNLKISPWRWRILAGVLFPALLGLISAAVGSVLFFGAFLWTILPFLLCFWYSQTSKRTSASRQFGIRIIWTVFAIISFISALVMPYCEGRTNSLWIVPPMFPSSILPWVWLRLSCIVLFVLCIRSLLARRQMMITSLMFLVSLILFGSWFKMRPAAIFQRGFNGYVKTALTAEEWRDIGRFARTNLLPEGTLPGPGKNSLWDEKEDRALWSALYASTQIGRLDPALTIYTNAGETEIEWGGTLEGHWGVIIFASKADAHQDPAAPRGSYARTNFIEDDIATFISSD